MSGERTPDIARVLITRDAIAATLTSAECSCRPGKGVSIWCREHGHPGKDDETTAAAILTCCGWLREYGPDQLDTMAALVVASAMPDDEEAN